MTYLVVLLMLMSLPAHAAETQVEKGTLVDISASAEDLLVNNQVVVDFRIEASGSNAAALHNEVNALAARVQAALKDIQGLRQQTTGRNLQVMNHYDKALGRQVRDGWRLVQGERIVGSNPDSAAAWVDAIEKAGAHLDRLRFNVSEAASRAALDELRMQAIQTFREKAATMAKALGAPSFRILNLHSDSRMPPAPVMQRGVMALSAESAPTLNSGESRLRVTVSGQILLPERVYTAKQAGL